MFRFPHRLSAVLWASALMLASLGQHGAAAPGEPDPVEHSTDHLIVLAWPLETAVVPGKPITIRFEVRPRPGHRIYAPGQPGYVGVAFDVPPDGIITGVETELPPPTEFVFVPTGERSFGFDRAFRMDVVVATASTREARDRIARAGGRVAVSGRFEYQACDDVLCYRPMRIPMTFSLEAVRAQPARKK
jgi:hypothetical protein